MDITSYIMGSIAGAKSASGLKYLVVDELPETGADNTIYLVPKSTSKTNNYYDEYMYISNAWELIGDTEIDLSNYQTLLTSSNKLNADYIDDTNTTNKLTNATEKSTWNGKQDALISGTNIKTINGNSVLGSGNLDTEIIQYSTMPTASADNLGKIVQYTGTTDSTYTNGYFYQCVSDEQDPATYSWENIQVQSGGGSSAPRYIEDENGNRLYVAYRNGNDNNLKSAVQEMLYDYNDGKFPAILITDKATYGTIPFDNETGIYIITSKNTYTSSNLIQWQLECINMSTRSTPTSSGTAIIIQNHRYSVNTDLDSLITYLAFNKLGTTSISFDTVSNPANKSYVDNKPTTYTGYDSAKTQVLKNINGTLTWVDEA